MIPAKTFRLNGYTNMVVAIILIGGALMAFGVLFYQVGESKEADDGQDKAIATLQQDVAVIKATTGRTEKDVQTLLRRE